MNILLEQPDKLTPRLLFELYVHKVREKLLKYMVIQCSGTRKMKVLENSQEKCPDAVC